MAIHRLEKTMFAVHRIISYTPGRLGTVARLFMLDTRRRPILDKPELAVLLNSLG